MVFDLYKIDAEGVHFPSLSAIHERLAKQIAADCDGKIAASLKKLGWTPPPPPDPESAAGMHGMRIANLSARIIAAQPDRCIMVLNDAEGVAFGGRFHGWLMRQHPDGHWVSIRKLDAVDPFNNPLGRMLKSTTK